METLDMKLRVVLEPSEDGGFTAHVPSLPGCISEGDTREEALKNIREAIELYLEPVEDDSSYRPGTQIEEIAV
jgi:predicted RNase H-like HicB family nuclease